MKKKKTQIFLDDDEKFVIPQVDYGMIGLIRHRRGFEKSEVASPVHGTNVVDRSHYVDNSGTVDIDYNYDFVREDSEKHISEEELIKRHGTKYYEFQTINKNENEEFYKGADYNKPEEKIVVKPKEETKAFSFISEIDDIEEETIDAKANLDNFNEEANNDDNYSFSDAEFKLDIKVDDEETEYNTYSPKMPKPEQTNIPSFLTPKREETTEYNSDDLEFDDNVNFNAPNIDFSNPAVDKNQSIEDAINNYNNNQIKFEEPKYKSTPINEVVDENDKYEEARARANEVLNNSLDNNVDKYANYNIPYNTLFKHGSNEEHELPQWLEEKKEIINNILASFDIDGEVVTYTKGPAFTRYEVILAAGVNVKKVNQIYDNLQKDLEVKSLRVLAPIPGKNTIGIEVPNDEAEVVSFGDIITDEFINDGKPLNVALGKDINGSPVYQNITSMPHALIAGATQSGKSVSINTILVSLITKNSPNDLKLILIDPKKVELTFYNDLPHLVTPVIDDPQIATEALKWAVDEMERRYDLLARNRVRNHGDYNKKRKEHPEMEAMPFIVIVIDEFNDLIMQCGAETNEAIIRLAQKARAAGIHIILATQRPTADIINGTIKNNIPCRIAFKVAAELDSRVILDEGGAENLLGRGDMLIKNNGTPVRAQGAYISDDEIGAVCDYICDRYDPDFMISHDDLKRARAKTQNGGGGFGSKEAQGEDETLLYEIAEACVQAGSCSINSIQSGFGIGFNRASRIVSILEERGVVSPRLGTKPREILVDSYKLREIFHVDE